MELRTCFYCGAEESDGLKFEKHHVFGRINSDLMVLACLNCHSKITKRQQKRIPKLARTRKASKRQKFAVSVLSMCEHQKLVFDEMSRLTKQQLKADLDE